MRRTVRETYQEHHYGILLVTLLAVFVMYSLVSGGRLLSWILLFVSTIAMIAAVVTTWGSRVWFVPALVLGLIGQSLYVYGELSHQPLLTVGGHAVRFVFMGFVMMSILTHILQARKPNLNVIFGAACVYILLGYTFADIYMLMDFVHPDSFSDATISDGSWVPRFGAMDRQSELVYYSMVTLTTVGYGDMVPNSPPARFVSAMEGLFGQLFLAIIIARLVGLEIGHRVRRHDS